MTSGVKFVKQEHKKGCAIACIAMVLGKTYEEIDRDFLRDFDKQGMPFEEVVNYLGEHGFSIVQKLTRNYYEKDFARREMLRPFAPVHVVSIQQRFDAKTEHLVVMTDKGKLICPHGETDKTIRDSYAVTAVLGLYR